MHIHRIANTIVPPPIYLSGCDRIMVECVRRWRQDHKITVYVNEGAKPLCDWFELKGIVRQTLPREKMEIIPAAAHPEAASLPAGSRSNGMRLNVELPRRLGARDSNVQ